MSLFAELKRRSVFRVAIGYIGVSWLVIQVIDVLFDIFGVGDRVAQIVVVVLAIGFVPAIVLAWVFEWTPEGIRRDSEADHEAPAMRSLGRRADRIIIAVLSVALLFFVVEKIWQPDPGPSIAVIPFENVSGDPAQDPLALGMTKQMRSMLTSVRELRVIAAYSVSALIDEGADRETMASELRLTHFLEGSIQTDGDRVRITAELVAVADGSQAWSSIFDRQLDDIFAIQDEIASEVLAQLEFGAAVPGPPPPQRVDTDALKLYFRADHLINFGGSDGADPDDDLSEAIALLEETITIEPTFVDAWLDLALARYRLFNFHAAEPDLKLLASADDALEQARQLEPRHPTVMAYLATTDFAENKKLQDVASLFELAIEASPTSGDVIRPAQQFVRSIGRLEIATAMAELAVDRDPECAYCWYSLSQILRDDGRHDEAEAAAEVALALGMNLDFSIATTQLYQHNPEPMLALFANIPVENSQDAWAQSLALFSAGRESEFEAMFRSLREDFVRENGDHQAPLDVAMVYAWSGQAEEAFRWLDTTIEQDLWGLQKNYRSPFFFNLRGDSRWNEILRRIERHPEQLAKIEFNPDIPRVGR